MTNKVPTMITGSGSPCCCHLHISASGNNGKVFNWLVLCMFTAEKMHNFLCLGHKILHLPRPRTCHGPRRMQYLIQISVQRNEFCILWAVNVHGAYQLTTFALCWRVGYEGDGGVMSHVLGLKKCRIKVFVMFCYLNGKNWSLSRFADVGPGLANFNKYRGIQQ